MRKITLSGGPNNAPEITIQISDEDFAFAEYYNFTRSCICDVVTPHQNDRLKKHFYGAEGCRPVDYLRDVKIAPVPPKHPEKQKRERVQFIKSPEMLNWATYEHDSEVCDAENEYHTDWLYQFVGEDGEGVKEVRRGDIDDEEFDETLRRLGYDPDKYECNRVFYSVADDGKDICLALRWDIKPKNK